MPKIETIVQLLEQLENLKTDKVKTEARFDDLIISEDYSKAQDIREKVAELMAVNNTLQSLSFRWIYLHKRQCRELAAYTEKQEIKIKLINSDNTLFPGEFCIPGFDEVDGLDTDDRGQAILAKDVAVYDRSKLQKELAAPVISIFGSTSGPSTAIQDLSTKAEQLMNNTYPANTRYSQ